MPAAWRRSEQNYATPGPATGPLGGAAVTLNNGTLVLAAASAAATTFNMVSGNFVTLNGTNDTILAGPAGAAVANGTVTLAGGTVAISAGQTLNLGCRRLYAQRGFGPCLQQQRHALRPCGQHFPGSRQPGRFRGNSERGLGGTLTLVSPPSAGTYIPAAGGTVVLSGAVLRVVDKPGPGQRRHPGNQ